ncbi:MAG: nucleotide sugar dehydrogenase [Clostridia bacterium]|nr:nucleotide sugar dehydrogenase [Clostridia bacterium]
MNRYRITIVGTGYVGMSLALLLGCKHDVCALDIDRNRIDLIHSGVSPIHDAMIDEYLREGRSTIRATTDPVEAYAGADYVFVAVPTDYDNAKQYFDTSIVQKVLQEILQINSRAKIIIKSTIPVGFTQEMRDRLHCENLFFSPEFLRESCALFDNLHPSRIIVGTDTSCPAQIAAAEEIADILADAACDEDVPVLVLGLLEAESIKLFANTYLAMRVAFFNELDTYAEVKGLNSRQIIEGVCLDPRIGTFYNNPSFGYGGYCLPKDSKQLLATFEGVPENLIRSVVDANETRKEFIADSVLARALRICRNTDGDCRKAEPVIGVFRVVMKSNSDNARNSSVQGIIERLVLKGVEVIVYEPALPDQSAFRGCQVVHDLNDFINRCTLIIANRYDPCLDAVADCVYTRDLFGRD